MLRAEGRPGRVATIDAGVAGMGAVTLRSGTARPTVVGIGTRVAGALAQWNGTSVKHSLSRGAGPPLLQGPGRGRGQVRPACGAGAGSGSARLLVPHLVRSSVKWVCGLGIRDHGELGF
jgi:hypothetical protein